MSWHIPENFYDWCLDPFCIKRCGKRHPATKCHFENDKSNCNNPYCTFIHNNRQNPLQFIKDYEESLLDKNNGKYYKSKYNSDDSYLSDNSDNNYNYNKKKYKYNSDNDDYYKHSEKVKISDKSKKFDKSKKSDEDKSKKRNDKHLKSKSSTIKKVDKIEIVDSSFNPMSTGFNPMSTGFNPMSTGFNPMSTGFNPISTSFNPMSTGFNQMPNSFNQMPNSFNQMPNSFNPMSTSFNQIPNGFNQMPNGFNQMPNGFNQMTNGFNQMPNVFNQMTNGFNQMPNSFNPINDEYNQSVQEPIQAHIYNPNLYSINSLYNNENDNNLTSEFTFIDDSKKNKKSSKRDDFIPFENDSYDDKNIKKYKISKCINGNKCVYYKNGTCKFYHSDSYSDNDNDYDNESYQSYESEEGEIKYDKYNINSKRYFNEDSDIYIKEKSCRIRETDSTYKKIIRPTELFTKKYKKDH
jgi:hypothetical protein